jgi:hypothetical protein
MRSHLRLQLCIFAEYKWAVSKTRKGRKMPECGGKWLQSIIFHSRLLGGIDVDGRTQSPIIELPYRWPSEKWLGIPEMPKGG